MAHNCRDFLCDTPHYEDACECDNCEECHGRHDLSEWGILPECWRCLEEMEEWADENS